MPTVKNVREASATFDLIVPENIPEVGVDGVSNALLGYPTSKLMFHVNVSPEAGIEQRKAVLNLSIGTLALIQLCQLTLAGLARNRAALDNAASEQATQLRNALISIETSPT